MIGIWLSMAALVAVLAGVLVRVRVARTVSGREPVVTDEVLRAVFDEVAELEEPLDEDEIRRAEEEFWSSEWEDPDPWHE